MGIGTEQIAIELRPNGVRLIRGTGGGCHLNPEQQPALLSPTPCADDDCQPVMLDVYRHRQDQAASRADELWVFFAEVAEAVRIRQVALVLVWATALLVRSEEHTSELQ